MRIPSGKTDQYVPFVAVDSTDLKTRETGLSSFTVYRSRNAGTATAYTTPTIVESSTSNMPGQYWLLVDEDTTIASTSDSEAYVVHITQASMAPVTLSLELYRRDTTTGNTLDVTATGAAGIDWGNVENKTTTNALTNTSIITTQKVDVETIKTNPVVNAGTITFPTTATLASTTNITAGTITTATNVTTVNGLAANVITATSINTGAITAAKFAAGAIDAAALAADAGTEIAAAVWDRLTSALTTVGSIGKLLVDNINATISSRASQTSVDTIDDFLDTEIAAILADTNELQTDWANGGRLDLILDARASQASVDVIDGIVDSILVDTAEIGAAGAGLTALATQASVNTIDDFLDTEIAAIITTLGTPAGASISADIAAIEAQTDDIGAAGAGLTAVPWNAAWDAEVQSEVADALTAYSAATATDVTNAAANVSVDEIQASALADLFNTDSGTTYASAVAGSVVKEIADNAGGSSLSEAGIATAVRTELTTELGRIDVATSTRASQASVDTVDTVADAIKAKTDSLTFTVAGQVDANAESMNATTINGTGVSGDLWRGA